MADTTTTHLGLIKQDPDSKPDIDKEHSNLTTLDDEVWKRGKAFNGTQVSADGEFHVKTIPYSENLESSASQKSDDSYIIRTTGGTASVADEGDAWLMLLQGRRTHTGYVAQSVTMTVTPMTRIAPAVITATLDEATFEAYVGTAGTYTISYTTEWDTSPTAYGLTVSNTPVNGDSITMVWDGENDATVTVNAADRPTPESISATINEETFTSYVSTSGTTTLTYSTDWSADPTNYGITVTGTPIAGDVITVVYVKEVRGTITQSNPQKFISTGWNLYNHTAGYARVLKYSTENGCGFKISGTYTALEFSTSPSGTGAVSITPVSGYFTVPSDGYVIVTGGNSTDTAIWMTWTDWGSGYRWNSGTSSSGAWEPYKESEIDLSGYMAEKFPYGLMQVGTVYDEININTGVALSRVVRQAYNSTNLANAKSSGLQYEYDENYIYIERSTPVTYDTSWTVQGSGTSTTYTLEGGYTANDHGMELFTGTDNAVYAQTIYGANLKNKLERDVVTISQQTLTADQQNQVCSNLGISKTVLRDVPFAIAVSDWSGSGSSWTASFVSSYITSTAKWILSYDSSISSYAKAHLNAVTTTGGGGLTFTSTKKPTGTITGTALVFDNDDGKLPVLIEETVISIANGGTGQSSLAGAQQALGITSLSNKFGNLKFVDYGIAQSTAANISCPNGAKGILFTVGSTDAISGAWIVFTGATNGTVSTWTIKSASNVTLTKTTNNIAVTASLGTYVYMLWFT